MILYVVRQQGGKVEQQSFVSGWKKGMGYRPIRAVHPALAKRIRVPGIVTKDDAAFLYELGYTHVTMRDGIENMIPLTVQA